MFVEIICPACRHRGQVVNRTLPRELLCSRCGSRNRFEAYETKRTDPRSPRPRVTGSAGIVELQLPRSRIRAPLILR